MVLSNAERQRLYRQRRNAAAKGENLPDRARQAMEEAMSVVWRVHAEEAGDDMQALYGYSTEEGWRASLFSQRESPAMQLRSDLKAYLHPDQESPLAGPDREVLERALALIQAVELEHLRPAPKPKTSRKTRG